MPSQTTEPPAQSSIRNGESSNFPVFPQTVRREISPACFSVFYNIPHKNYATRHSLVVVTAVLAAPSFARFLDDEADDYKRGYGVYPPRAEHEVCQQADNYDERQPAADDTLGSICPHSAAAELRCNRDLATCQ